MDKEDFTSIHVLKSTKEKIDKIVDEDRRKLYDIMDIIIDFYIEKKKK